MEQKRLPFNFEATKSLKELFQFDNLDSLKIKELVLNGADVNVVVDEKKNLSPLMLAIMKKQTKLACFLLSYGASPSHFNSFGQDCLEFAILTRQSLLVKLLLNLGAKPNRFNGNGETALNLAIKLGDVEMVKSLIKSGADVNMPSLKAKLTPLLIAKCKGEKEIEKMLVRAGAKESIAEMGL